MSVQTSSRTRRVAADLLGRRLLLVPRWDRSGDVVHLLKPRALGRPFIEICVNSVGDGRTGCRRARLQTAAAIWSLASGLWQGLDQPQHSGSDASIGYLVERLYKAQIVPLREKLSEDKGQEFESLRARHAVLVSEHEAPSFRLARTAFSRRSLLPLIRIAWSSTSTTSMSDCK